MIAGNGRIISALIERLKPSIGFVSNVITAFEAIKRNKLRSMLTSLGIVFGVASVISMLAIGRGAQQEILDQMKLLGANNIIITPIIEQEEGKVEEGDAKTSEKKKFSPGLSLQYVEYQCRRQKYIPRRIARETCAAKPKSRNTATAGR